MYEEYTDEALKERFEVLLYQKIGIQDKLIKLNAELLEVRDEQIRRELRRRGLTVG